VDFKKLQHLGMAQNSRRGLLSPATKHCGWVSARKRLFKFHSTALPFHSPWNVFSKGRQDRDHSEIAHPFQDLVLQFQWAVGPIITEGTGPFV
jgi:hypothetical protein